ncbi:hypothetical protein F5887DRAFT_969647 [Amanita rubescens]|nr:hypothetical protein F5887DRAFT_969647 [Amanita rubescens]
MYMRGITHINYSDCPLHIKTKTTAFLSASSAQCAQRAGHLRILSPLILTRAKQIMVKNTLVTSIAIIQFALLSQVSVGLPIAEHCRSKRSSTAIGVGVGVGCGTLGAVIGTVGYLTRPPVPASAARAAAHAEGEPAQREQGTTHGHTSDPDAITPAPPRPGEEPNTSKKAGKAPITQQPVFLRGDHEHAVPGPEPAHLAQPKGYG